MGGGGGRGGGFGQRIKSDFFICRVGVRFSDLYEVSLQDKVIDPRQN